MEMSMRLCSIEISFEQLQWQDYTCCGVEEGTGDQQLGLPTPDFGVCYNLTYVSNQALPSRNWKRKNLMLWNLFLFVRSTVVWIYILTGNWKGIWGDDERHPSSRGSS